MIASVCKVMSSELEAKLADDNASTESEATEATEANEAKPENEK